MVGMVGKSKGKNRIQKIRDRKRAQVTREPCAWLATILLAESLRVGLRAKCFSSLRLLYVLKYNFYLLRSNG